MRPYWNSFQINFDQTKKTIGRWCPHEQPRRKVGFRTEFFECGDGKRGGRLVRTGYGTLPSPDKPSIECVQYPGVTENQAGGPPKRVTVGHTGLGSELSRVQEQA